MKWPSPDVEFLAGEAIIIITLIIHIYLERDTSLIGPFELPQTLNGEHYLHFLENDLTNLLEEISLNLRAGM